MEEEDIIDYYNNFNGDMTSILEWIPLSNNNDISRFISIIENLFLLKKLKKTKLFNQTKSKIKLLPDESQELEEDLSKLKNQIILKNQDKPDFFEYLSNKYNIPKNEDEGNEEDFKNAKDSKNKKKGKKKN